LFKQAFSTLKRSKSFAHFVSLLEQIDRSRPDLLAILTYHRVDQVDAYPHLSAELLGATPETFEEQMHYLATHYPVVSVQDVLDKFEKGITLPARAVMITFDDAYCGFAEHVWPILKSYQLPAALFVPTAFPDQPTRTFWWDRLFHALYSTSCTYLETAAPGRIPLETPQDRRRAYKQLRAYVKSLEHDRAMEWVEQTCAELGVSPVPGNVLGWDALRQLAQEGVTLGAHTQTHFLMNRVSPERAMAEAVGSRRDLEREIGKALPIFAYPSGGFNDEVVAGLKREGFVLAFTTNRGLNDLRTVDPLRLRRINVGRLAPLAAIRAQLLPSTRYLNHLYSA